VLDDSPAGLRCLMDMALVLAFLPFCEMKIKHPPKHDERMGNLSARHTAHSPKRTTNNLKSKPTNSHHERGNLVAQVTAFE
jgi:hypothetical protein